MDLPLLCHRPQQQLWLMDKIADGIRWQEATARQEYQRYFAGNGFVDSV